MKPTLTFLLGSLMLAATQTACAQDEAMSLPKSIEAGSSFSIQNAGSGEATLYIVGPSEVLKRTVQLGDSNLLSCGIALQCGPLRRHPRTSCRHRNRIIRCNACKHPRQPEFSCQAVAPSSRSA